MQNTRAIRDNRYILLQIAELLLIKSGWEEKLGEILKKIGTDTEDKDYKAMLKELVRVKGITPDSLFAELKASSSAGIVVSQYGFNPAIYQSLLFCMIVGDFLEKTQSAKNSAYKLTVMFGEVQSALNYLKEYQKINNTVRNPIHNACLFNLPEDEHWDVKAWQLFSRQYLINDQLRNGFAVSNASKVDIVKILSGIRTGLDLTNLPGPDTQTGRNILTAIQKIGIHIRYARASEDEEAAAIYARCQVEGKYIPESVFNEYLDKIKPLIENSKGSDEKISPIFIDGKKYGCPGYYIMKLSHKDPKGAILGYLTACCQSLGREGATCAIHGMTSDNSGFYIICKGAVPKNQSSTVAIPLKDIVAQTWAWANEEGEKSVIVLDSLERLPAIPQLKLSMLTQALANELMEKKNVSQVNIGGGGETPSLLKYDETLPMAFPPSYKGYSDAKLAQFRLCNKLQPLYGMIFINPEKAISLYHAMTPEEKLNYDENTVTRLYFRRLILVNIYNETAKSLDEKVADFGNTLSIIKKYIDEASSESEREQRSTIYSDALGKSMGEYIISVKVANREFNDEDRHLIKFLVENGANPNAILNEGKTAMMFACQFGDIETVKLLLEAGAKINITNTFGESPLYIAVARNHIDVVKYLLEQGANANSHVTKDKVTLFRACEVGNIEVVNLLLDAGAEVNVSNKYKITPLKVALYKGYIDVVKALVKKKARTHEKSDEFFINAVLELDKGSDINKMDQTGDPLLHKLLVKSPLELHYGGLLKYILEKGANPNLVNNCVTPLHITIRRFHTNAIGDDDWDFRLLNALFEKSADIHATGVFGNTSLHLAIECMKNTIYKDKPEELSDFKLVKYLLAKGANINAANENGVTPFYLAVSKTHQEDGFSFLTFLLEHGANINAANAGETPLHNVVRADSDINLVKYLLARGADANVINDEGEIPLITALKRKDIEIAMLLLEKNIDINKPDSKGKTALYYAIQTGELSVVQQLLDKGADITKACLGGVTKLKKSATDAPKNARFLYDLLSEIECSLQKKAAIELSTLQTFSQFAHNERHVDNTMLSHEKDRTKVKK